MKQPHDIPHESVVVALDYCALCAEMIEPVPLDDGLFVCRQLPQRMDIVREAALNLLEQHFLDAVRGRRIAEAAS